MGGVISGTMDSSVGERATTEVLFRQVMVPILPALGNAVERHRNAGMGIL